RKYSISRRRPSVSPASTLTLWFHAESRVRPRADVLDHFLGDLPLGQQEAEHLLLPQLEKRFRGQLGQRQEGSVRQKHAFGNQGVNVRVPMDQVPERLNGP